MSLWGWIFMVGFRVFDVGGLIAWLVWFFRLRDDEDDDLDEDGGGGGNDRVPEPAPDGGGGGPAAQPWPHRRRDHLGDRPSTPVPGRRRAPAPPAREPVRR